MAARTPDRQIAKLNVAARARQHSEKAIQKLADLLDSDDERVVLDAATRLLDRGHGKPTQTIEQGDKSPDTMTDAELINAIREAARTDLDEAAAGKGKLN